MTLSPEQFPEIRHTWPTWEVKDRYGRAITLYGHKRAEGVAAHWPYPDTPPEDELG